MNIDQAFDEIMKKLKAASGRGIKQSIRASGKDWVCSLEDQEARFNIIAKDGELMMVNLESKNAAPHVERIDTPGVTQQELIKRIQNAIAEVCGE